MKKRDKKWIITVPLCVSLVLSLLTPALAAEGETAQAADLSAVTGPSGTADASGSTGPGGFNQSSVQEQELEEDLVIGNKIAGTPYDETGLLTYRSENGEVTIMSCSEAIMGELYVPAYINGEPVTAIDDYAFLYCAALTAVTLPETVTEVGANAFSCCTQLSSVTFEGEGVSLGRRAFYFCRDLTQVHFKGNVALVGECAFGYCTGLDTIDFQQGVEKVGDYAFENCTGLTAIDFLKNVKEIGSYAFSGCTGLVDVTIPATVSSLGDRVFYECKALERAVLDDGMAVTQVGTGLFYDCWKLTTVHLPASWTTIPDETFYNCPRLEYTLPDNLEYIGAYAFKSCVGLSKDLVIPAGVTEIGEGAFQNCRLNSAVLPEGLTEIKAYTFDNQFEKTMIGVTLPEGLISIGKFAFGGNRLESLKLPSTLEVIEDCAFAQDGSMSYPRWYGIGTVSEIELPPGLKYLGNNALACCAGAPIEELVLPESLTYLGNYYGVGNPKRLVLPAGLQEIGSDAFYGLDRLEELVIQCPASAFDPNTTFGPFNSCSALTSVTIPEDWTEIPTHLFYGSGLSGITIPEGITAIGASAFTDCANLTSVQLPSTLTTIGASAFSNTAALTDITLPDSLTGLGSSAFASSGLTSVVLPENVETVGSNAFQNCGSLTEITLCCDVDGSSVFAGCDALTTLTFGPGVTVLGASCFEGCKSLRTVQLSDTVREIGASAFKDCSALCSVNFPEGLEAIKNCAFWGTSLTTVSLPSTLTRLEPVAFGSIPTLTTVHLAEGMANDAFRTLQISSEEGVGGMEGYFTCKRNSYSYPDVYENGVRINDAAEYSAFYGCSALSSINIPKNWTYIPAKFLRGCDGPLGKITLGDSITAVGSNAFQGAVGITAIKLPEGLQSLGAYALYGCTGLAELVLPAGLPEDGLGAYAIGGCSNLKTVSLPEGWTCIPDALFQGNRNIETYDIPEGVTRIGEYAFADSAVKTVSLPDTLTEIGAYAFQNCAGLSAVTLPESLTKLEMYAFSGTGLTGITVPGGVDAIGQFAFYDCDSLKTATVQPGVTTIDGLAFGNCGELTQISIPDSAVNLARTILYGSNPGNVTVQCSAGSMAEDLAESLLYLGSDRSPSLEGATFRFDDRYPWLTDMYYYLDYQGMGFRIVNSAANEERSYQDYTVRNNISNYYAVLLGWEPSWTSLVVPDDVGGIPVKYFGSNTGYFVYCSLTNYAMTRGGPMSSYESNGSQLRSLTVGANMETVGGDLSYLTQLEEIVLKEGVTEISEKTFKGLIGLTSVVMPSTLVSIGKEAFEDCENLSSVTFQEGLEVIDLWAFRNTALTDVYLPSTLRELSPTAFDSDVVIHFTGSASGLKYQWLDDQLVLHIDPTLSAQLEVYGIRIAQFQGEGLDSQGSYFISTEAAGLNQPSSRQTAETALEQTADTDLVAETAPVLENLDVPNEIVMEAPEEPEIVEEPETVEEPEEQEEKPVVYEVMLDVVEAIRNNPLVTVCVIAGAALLIILGAWHRWSVTRKEE